MKWTKEPPKVPGLYKRRWKGVTYTSRVRVTDYGTARYVEAECMTGQWFYPSACGEEWAGPIPEPEEGGGDE